MRGKGLIFNGEYVHQLDEKVRFKLPKRMEEIFTEELGIKCVLMKMPEKCLAIYPSDFWHEEFGKYLEAVDAKMPGNEKYRRFTRTVASNSFESKVGAQGRVALTDAQRDYIGVAGGENIVIVGAGERIEIWSEGEWKRQQEQDMDNYYNLLEDVAKDMERKKRGEEELG